MLSRILSKAAALPAVAIVWPRLEPTAPVATRKAVPPEPKESSITPDQLQHLQSRVMELEREIEHSVHEARESGFLEGEAAGKTAAMAQIQPLSEQLAKSIDELAGLRPQLRRQAEGDLLKLAVAIAGRILHRELTIDSDAMKALIRVALEQLQSQEICRVRVHPEQVQTLRDSLERLRPAQEIECLADPGLDRGALIFDTTRGNLDASIQTQLREIEGGRSGPVTPKMMSVPDCLDIASYIAQVQRMDPLHWGGEVVELIGLLVESLGPAVAIGDFCEIRASGGRRIRTQVIGFRNGRVLSMPLEETDGLQLGDPIIARSEEARIPVGPGLLGRVLNGFGATIDGKPDFEAADAYQIYRPPPSPLEREHITEPLVTGIRVIDGILPCGRGQRIGIFGGSGVGKSTLLGAMARHNDADVTVIALIGERNREVRAFLEQELGPDGMKHSVAVVATSDQPAPLRVRACFVALAIAEYFRDQGASVLLVMDSVTRLAMAQREIGLAAGEPPSQKGYTPSVFNLLPKIFERAGNFQEGSITGFFTVLVEGDDFNEPICDAVRAILDGHIVLSRELGDSGHYPAIDVLGSVSRLTSRIATKEQAEWARKVREALSMYRQSQDLIQLGAYAAGSNARLDASIRARPQLIDFLRQDADFHSPREETLRQLETLASTV